jgi:RNA polymerase sigma-70 factor (ECF subfamily)
LTQVSLDELVGNVPQERTGPGFGTRDLMQAGVIDRLAIDAAVSTLAPGYRTIFTLYDVQGFGHEEIASMLHCTRGSTKSQLHKARTALRGVLSAPRIAGSEECKVHSGEGSAGPRKKRGRQGTELLRPQSNAMALAR